MKRKNSRARKSTGKSRRRSTARSAVTTGAAAVMVSLSSLVFFRAVAATATLPIIARIVRAVEITVNTSLDFGTLAITNDVAGLATVDPGSSQLKIDGKGGLALAGGVPRAGRIQIKGAAMPVQVSMEANNIQLTNGKTFLTIDNFNISTAQAGPQATVTPTGPGNGVILSVGASVNTRPGQLSGTYSGSNRVFANYQ